MHPIASSYDLDYVRARNKKKILFRTQVTVGAPLHWWGISSTQLLQPVVDKCTTSSIANSGRFEFEMVINFFNTTDFQIQTSFVDKLYYKYIAFLYIGNVVNIYVEHIKQANHLVTTAFRRSFWN